MQAKFGTWPICEVFWKTYVAGHKPLVLRGIGAQSEGLKKWSMEYVEENFGCTPRAGCRCSSLHICKICFKFKLAIFGKCLTNCLPMFAEFEDIGFCQPYKSPCLAAKWIFVDESTLVVSYYRIILLMGHSWNMHVLLPNNAWHCTSISR